MNNEQRTEEPVVVRIISPDIFIEEVRELRRKQREEQEREKKAKAA